MEYILFYGNSFTSTMLIPVNKLTESRNNEFEFLKSFSEKTSENTYKFTIEYKQTSKNSFHQKDHPMLKFVNFMDGYAHGMDEDCYFNLEDKIWYDESILNLCYDKKFGKIIHDHQINFDKLMLFNEYNNIPIKIVEGFLIIDNIK